jgi:two-component system chemotaxis response regulator CheY
MPSILIADDSSLARMVTRRSLEVAGLAAAEFVEAVDGAQALDILRKRRFDILVSDITMPVMDGVELLRQVKSVSMLKSMPVIVITSAGNRARIAELTELGADAVFAKPIDVPALVQALRRLLPQVMEKLP